MEFYQNQLFHIYNQGNNQRQTFFTDEHRKFFLWKMRAYLLPFGDLVAWCLMSNHFHWQFYVREVSMKRKELWEAADKIEWMRRVSKYGKKAQPVRRDWTRMKGDDKLIHLNEAIGILQRSYSNAVNKERDWSGSLFKEHCQAKDGWINEFVTSERNGKEDYRFLPGNDYSFRCFNYVHNNPVEAKIVQQATDYEWSSAKDYAGLRRGTLCNLEMGRRLRDFILTP